MSKLDRLIDEYTGCFIVLVTIFTISSMIFIFMVLIYAVESSACNNVHRLTKLETDVSLTLGCMVKYEGRWVVDEVVIDNKHEVTIRAEK